MEKSKFSVYSDEELMSFLIGGEVAAFDELYARYGRRLMAYFTRMWNYDKAAAEDSLQDVFMKIAEAPERFDTTRSFRAWIFTLAANICRNHYRHSQTVKQSRDEIKQVNTPVNEHAFISLAMKMDGAVFRKMLNEVLGELPHEKREAFILKYQEDKSIAEIALIQNCPEGSVKSRLHYTVKILEEKLKIFHPQH